MKISVKQYAQGLYEATKDKTQSEIGGIISNFVTVLSKSGQLKNKNKIIEKFGEIYNQENKIIEAEVTSREKIPHELRNKTSNYVRNKYKAEKVIINNKIDENIKGGIIIRVGDEVLDGSVARQLKELKNKLIL